VSPEQEPINTQPEAPEPAPETPVVELKKHYAVDFGGTGKVKPVRKNKVTTTIVTEKCKPGVAVWQGHSVRYYLAEGAVCQLLAPYLDSKLM
jgi:hypothetical protein